MGTVTDPEDIALEQQKQELYTKFKMRLLLKEIDG